MNAKLDLFFSTSEVTLLSWCEFKDIGANKVLRCVRGKTSGAFPGYGTFQWTAAVRALSILSVRIVLNEKDSSIEPRISGGQGSATRSLDYALAKEPSWITEMFGVSSTGKCRASRLFLRTNSHQKRPGPVSLTLNTKILGPKTINIFSNDRQLVEPYELKKMLVGLEKELKDNCARQGEMPLLRDAA